MAPAILFLLSLLLLSVSAPISADPATTTSTAITLFGDARFNPDDYSVTLTKELNCSAGPNPQSFSVGRALYVAPVRFLDPKSKATASFATTFTFSITPCTACNFGDGLAFLITSNAESFIHFDGYLGLPYSSSSYNTPDAYFAVEFDTNFDAALGDISGNHVGIDLSSVISFASVDGTSRGVDLKSKKELTAWIEYRHPETTIRVWIGDSSIRPSNPLIVAQIDLSKQFKQLMHVGFSASNGRGSAAHKVKKWRFKTVLGDQLQPLDSVGEGNCLLCCPDDNSGNEPVGFFQDLSQKFKSGVDKVDYKAWVGIATSLTGVVAIAGFFVVRKKLISRIEVELSDDVGEGSSVGASRVPERLSLCEIQSATKGFSKKRVIGEGASSTVYRGLLPSGELVAVKRFNHIGRVDCFQNSFTNEFATVVGFLSHQNLIQLLGWCCEGNELILVYEFMVNGSLDKLLHQRRNACAGGSVLTWEKRVKIVLGVASALTYLHEECERQIIHRDIKACNIMLDAEFNAKLGDFGLAEVYEHSSTNRQATLPAGTMGYLAPEYVYSGVPSEKTDVYSFGVVILEMVTGRRPVDDDGTVVVDKVWEIWERGRLTEAADPKLKGRFKTAEIERMLMVGLLCAHPNCKNRPTVKEAAKIIKGEAPVPFLPVKKPILRMGALMLNDSDDIAGLGGDNGSSPVLDEGYMTPKTHFG